MFYFTLPNKWQTPSQCHQCARQSHPDPLKTSFHSLFSLYYALLLPNNNSTSNISALSLSNCSRMECQNSYIQVLRYVFWCQRHSVWAICQQSKRNLTTLFSHLSLSLFNRMDSMGVWPEVTLFIHITWYISGFFFFFTKSDHNIILSSIIFTEHFPNDLCSVVRNQAAKVVWR